MLLKKRKQMVTIKRDEFSSEDWKIMAPSEEELEAFKHFLWKSIPETFGPYRKY